MECYPLIVAEEEVCQNKMLVNQEGLYGNCFEYCGIGKVLLVGFKQNTQGDAFWEKMGFTAREDLVYRNLSLTDATRIDT